LNLLLDTHIVLWCLGDNPRLPNAARSAIKEAERVFVSIASAWELAIKAALGKLEYPPSFELAIEESGYLTLLVGFAHVERLRSLPLHHSDPFDRMLVAQAQVESLTLVTKDTWCAAYDVQLLDVS
jgi:PIN domain nuclease of toxin-antitoxin system